MRGDPGLGFVGNKFQGFVLNLQNHFLGNVMKCVVLLYEEIDGLNSLDSKIQIAGDSNHVLLFSP